jgi:hypothetical protein
LAALGLGKHDRAWSLAEAGAIALPASMAWTMIEGFEIARKIRAPDDETLYDTYSKVWGPAVAVVVAAALQTWTLAAGLILSSSLGLPLFVPGVLLVAYGALLYGYRRFMVTLTPPNSRLGHYAQGYVLLILLALFAAQALQS